MSSDAPQMIDSTNGCRLALHHLTPSVAEAPDERPHLLICHATGFHGRAYAPLARALAARFDVWAIDTRGHGASPAPADGDFDWRGMAHDVTAAVDALGGEPVLAVGHSMGGAAILLAEVQRPGTIGAAYLFEPIVVPEELATDPGKSEMGGPARNRREIFPSKAEALWRYASRPPLNVLRSDALSAYVDGGFDELDDGTVQLACRAESEARTFEASGKPTVPSVAHLTLPFTVANGGATPPPSPADFSPLLADAAPNATLVTYPHLGHFGPFEAPEQIAEDIITALAP